MGLKRLSVEPEAPAAITAAVAQVDLGEGSSWRTWKFGAAQWQTESWRLNDIVGEHNKLARRVGAACAQARLFVTEVGEDGEFTGEVKDPRIASLAAVPLGTGAERDENLRLAGTDLAVAGECYFVGEGAARKTAGEPGQWFVVTSAAVSGGNGRPVTVERPKLRGGSKIELQDGVDILTRCWFSHPNRLDEADSYARSAIPVLREIELLTKREFAELDSRLTGAGLMPIPESATLPHGPDETPGINSFMAYVQHAAAASMTDQSTAQAMVPIMFQVPDELMQYMDAMRPITFWSPLSAEIADMKAAAITRFASFADIPPESLTGVGDANHWSAWLITEEGIRWIGQYLGVIADALTRGFLRSALAEAGIEDVARYAFAFDTAPLAARPNRLQEAGELWDRNLISDEEMVRAGAFDTEQMPAPEELTRRRLWDVVKLSPDLIRDPAIQSALGLPEISGVSQSTVEPLSEPEDDPGAVSGPPELDGGDPVPTVTASGSGGRVSQEALNIASKMLVLRALELAGGRLATPAERRGKWAEIPRYDLHHHVGPVPRERAERVMTDAWALVPAMASELGVSASGLTRFLDGYVLELLTRGIRHSDDLLFHGLSIANQGRGLTA